VRDQSKGSNQLLNPRNNPVTRLVHIIISSERRRLVQGALHFERILIVLEVAFQVTGGAEDLRVVGCEGVGN